MRTIKFRVWNKKTQSWIYGPNNLDSVDGVNLVGETILLGCFLAGVSVEDLNEIVALQYVGKKDKNGKSIFEGDIIRIPTTDQFTGEAICRHGAVYYDESFAQYRFKGNETTHTLFGVDTFGEIIGNIFDNPALLK